MVSTTGCLLLCFLDAFSGYHQIMMAVEDQEKTAFITPKGCYCYNRMPFGLRNAGATFQRAMQACLGPQLTSRKRAIAAGASLANLEITFASGK